MILVNKPLGWTPLQALEAVKIQYPEYANANLGYAGRLDPMAEGLLLILVNEENDRQQEHLNLEKEYEAEFVLGIETDTYDVLGRITNTKNVGDISKDILEQVFAKYRGPITQSYPPFSSVRVKGKPLFWWALHNKLDEIEIPKTERIITSLELLNSHTISASEFHSTIQDNIAKVSGNFRQELILKDWDNYFKKYQEDRTIYRIHVACSSGTYIRTLIHDIGSDIGYGAIATKIIRTRIGPYQLKDAITLTQ